MKIGVASDEQILPVGLKFWKEAKKLFSEKSINFIKTYHVKENLKWQQLFDEIGFEYLGSVYRFMYEGAKFNEPNICVLKYEDKYYDDKMRLESEAFSVLRKENDINPYKGPL